MRNRMLQDKIWTSEQFMLLSRDARLLFIGLLMMADDNGILKKSKLSIKAAIFPSDNLDVEPLIQEVIDNKLAYCYPHLEITYMIIPNFTKHQKINHPTFDHPIPCDEDLRILDIEKSEIVDEHILKRSCTRFKLSVKENKNSGINEGCPEDVDRTLVGRPEDVDRTSTGCPSNVSSNIIESNIEQCKISKIKKNTLLSLGPTEVVGFADECASHPIFDLFNSMIEETKMPKLRLFSPARLKKLKSAIKLVGDNPDDWRKIFLVASYKGFQKPDGTVWTPDFDYIFKNNNFVKFSEQEPIKQISKTKLDLQREQMQATFDYNPYPEEE